MLSRKFDTWQWLHTVKNAFVFFLFIVVFLNDTFFLWKQTSKIYTPSNSETGDISTTFYNQQSLGRFMKTDKDLHPGWWVTETADSTWFNLVN